LQRDQNSIDRLKVLIEFEAAVLKNRKTLQGCGSRVSFRRSSRHQIQRESEESGSRKHFVREVAKNVWNRKVEANGCSERTPGNAVVTDSVKWQGPIVNRKEDPKPV